jgi:hypothetical protein
MKKKCLLVFALALGCITCLSAQEKSSIFSNMELNGYIKYMNTSTFAKIDSTWLIDNLLHNRLNFSWYISNSVTLKISSRNRLISGDQLEINPNYAESLALDTGYLNFLTNNVASGESYVLTTTFDRAFLEYNYNNITVSVGRQRINWGQTFVWNPNDIFNSYSFFDFDYEERPGSDAIRVQYYLNSTAVSEAVVKLDQNNNITAAGLYRFNKWGYDIQFMGGIIDTTDYVVGMGWSGSIKKMGFNGELSYFYPQDRTENASGDLIASAGANYSFNSSLSVTFEGNYNSFADKIDITNLTDLFAAPLSVKTISLSRFSWFGQMSYAVNPLLSTSLAVMYLPSLDNGYYVMPSIQYSLQNNLELSVVAQRFRLAFNEDASAVNLLFVRLRWSF